MAGKRGKKPIAAGKKARLRDLRVRELTATEARRPRGGSLPDKKVRTLPTKSLTANHARGIRGGVPWQKQKK